MKFVAWWQLSAKHRWLVSGFGRYAHIQIYLKWRLLSTDFDFLGLIFREAVMFSAVTALKSIHRQNHLLWHANIFSKWWLHYPVTRWQLMHCFKYIRRHFMAALFDVWFVLLFLPVLCQRSILCDHYTATSDQRISRDCFTPLKPHLALKSGRRKKEVRTF